MTSANTVTNNCNSESGVTVYHCGTYYTYVMPALSSTRVCTTFLQHVI